MDDTDYADLAKEHLDCAIRKDVHGDAFQFHLVAAQTYATLAHAQETSLVAQRILSLQDVYLRNRR